MGSYEDMLTLMRKQAASGGSSGIQLAEMMGPNSLKIDDMPLTSEDLMFDDALVHPPDGKIALRVGDTVAVTKYSDTLYLVLGKMVRA